MNTFQFQIPTVMKNPSSSSKFLPQDYDDASEEQFVIYFAWGQEKDSVWECCPRVRVSRCFGFLFFSHLLVAKFLAGGDSAGHPLVYPDAGKMLAPQRRGTRRRHCCSSKVPDTTVTNPSCFCENTLFLCQFLLPPSHHKKVLLRIKSLFNWKI